MRMTRQLRSVLSLPIIMFMIGVTLLQAQTANSGSNSEQLNAVARQPATSRLENDTRLANQALAALKRLEKNVLAHRTLSDFESDGRVARVSLETFNAELASVTREIQPLLAELSDDKLRAHLINALDSYRDGAFWWSRIEQPRVIPIQQLSFTRASASPAEVFFAGTVPYTVVNNWRQANKFLLKAERLISPRRSSTWE
jgi:hypothetical protein